jgi:predicted ATPase
VIRRLYINKYRGLDNFELSIAGQSSVLLIGKNGSGKTSVGSALEILQRIARGTNQVGLLARPKDFTRGRIDSPMRFEIEVELLGEVYEYIIAFELPAGFKDLRVFEEKFSVAGKTVYSREQAHVRLARSNPSGQWPQGEEPLPIVSLMQRDGFPIDWHLVALPVLQERPKEPLSIFKRWLARMLILAPIPNLITGDSETETLEPDRYVTQFGAWFSGLLAHSPAAYAKIDEYLKQVMPDFKDITNPPTGRDSRSLVIQFFNSLGNWGLLFRELSDGEKSFMICALVLASAASDAYRPAFCFWDEPDNYLAPDEVQDFVLSLRRAFLSGGQFIATSHNPEGIRCFSNENTLVLFRKNHFEPTIVRPLHSLQIHGDLVGALTRGDVEP